ncbi:hypothetical protein J2X12_004145 [Pseudarthrobacter oxydans]|uniref:Uncharacterized protein n=1 Tax=Pseudarthrobacter oxydans TaxID=1671 RepID=A0AAW8NGS7_PSEOX|nr:hypothetical protein [Pseudarthrobacter oxydans]MDR6794707.1 hypothetical protein [Pseudarthrobacter oxydans]MDR7166091.1 hypothetical protein [Pseudarthrobacter oxydans]
MSSKDIKPRAYPRQKKSGESVVMAISVNQTTPQALRMYQAWRKQNNLPKAGNGVLLETALYQHDAKFRQFVNELKQKGVKQHAKRYIDNFKTGA